MLIAIIGRTAAAALEPADLQDLQATLTRRLTDAGVPVAGVDVARALDGSLTFTARRAAAMSDNGHRHEVPALEDVRHGR